MTKNEAYEEGNNCRTSQETERHFDKHEKEDGSHIHKADETPLMDSFVKTYSNDS